MLDIFSVLNETTNKHIIKQSLVDSEARFCTCCLKCYSNKRFCLRSHDVGNCSECVYFIKFLPLLQHIKHVWAYVNMHRGVCRYWSIKDDLYLILYSLIPTELLNYRLIREQVNNLDDVEIIKLAGILMDISNEIEEENNGKEENQNN